MQCREKLPWLLITLSVSFSLSLQYFSLNQRKGREIEQELDSKREKAGRVEVMYCWDLDSVRSFRPGFEVPGSIVPGRQVLRTVENRITQSSLVQLIIRLFGKINSPYLPVPSPQKSSPFLMGAEFQTQLWRIWESKPHPPTPTWPNLQRLSHIQLKLYRIH